MKPKEELKVFGSVLDVFEVVHEVAKSAGLDLARIVSI